VADAADRNTHSVVPIFRPQTTSELRFVAHPTSVHQKEKLAPRLPHRKPKGGGLF
jgi:hypothetical protein